MLGDCVEQMRARVADSVDAIVTDPPYGIRFMGMAWDGAQIEEQARLRASQKQPLHKNGEESSAPRVSLAEAAGSYDVSLDGNRAFQAWTEDWAREALRVLKPGGFLLASCGPRTYHRMACGVEEAGFEIRDSLDWLYAQGFPKSKNLRDDLDGLGTALKPAKEDIVFARKPLSERSVEANVRRWGTGALRINDARIPFRSAEDEAEAKGKNRHADFGSGPRDNQVYGEDRRDRAELGNYNPPGRWPANVLLDEEAARLLDEQGGDPGGVSRFFFVAKASRRERDAGLEAFAKKPPLWSSGTQNPGSFQSPGTEKEASNNHPTVKPIALMRHLVRLVTPRGGLVLDPFTGSGTTGCAAILEGVRFLGFEKEPAYVEIARARIAHWEGTLTRDGRDRRLDEYGGCE